MKKKTSTKPLINLVAASTPVRSFVDDLVAAEETRERFYMTSLDRAIRQAITQCRLFVMPKGCKFAYCRGTGPVGMANVSPGPYEEPLETVKPLPKRSLSLTYTADLINEEDESERRHQVRVKVPYRFTSSFSETQDPSCRFPKLKAYFAYDESELQKWIDSEQVALYRQEAADVQEQIEKLKVRHAHLTKNMFEQKPYAPSSSSWTA